MVGISLLVLAFQDACDGRGPLASILGFDACGIEVQSELVLAADELADCLGCDVRFAHGSFMASCDEDLIKSAEHLWWHTTEGSVYQDLDLDPEDIDLLGLFC